MTSQDFTYWLQGFFELTEQLTVSKHQTELIKKHLQLVFKYDENPSSFINWLDGYLEDKEDINAEQVDKIEGKLSKIFKHEIDPTYGDEEMQNELNTIHHNPMNNFMGGAGGSGTVYRC